jgi:hypothetical protein
MADVDPKTLDHRIMYNNGGKALIKEVSVAIDTGDAFSTPSRATGS